MIRCMRSEVNLKSSAYNPTGQNYFKQLAAYNSMSQHLRRILSAKSVVDTRNKAYMCRKNKRSKATEDRRVYSLPEMTDDIIDRLAYDTRHHPMDILRMKLNPECPGCCDRNLEYRRSRNCDRPCCKGSSQTGRRQRSTSRSQKSTSPATTSKRKKFLPNTICRKEFKTAQKDPYTTGSSVDIARQRKFAYETDSVFVPCTTTTLDPFVIKPTCPSPIQETSDHRSVSPRTPRDQASDSDHNYKAVGRPASQKDDEKKYINFVHDITKDIMQSGLYTDKELQDVFKRHIDKNKGTLNMNRMLYEIYQLKISLNMLDDESDIDDELEDLIHAQKLLHVSEIRPPTPPKVLDENKVMEKLQAYQRSMETRSRQPNSVSTKTVVLVDANPELLLTERDVLISLIEAGIDPKQAQHVCKSLFYRNKDLSETLAGEAKVSPPSLSQPSLTPISTSLKPRDGERRTSLVVATPESVSVEENSVHHSVEQEAKSSSVSDLVATRNETVETEKETDPQATSDVHEVKSEASYSYSDSQFEKSEESPVDDRRTSLTVETAESSRASVKDHSTDSSVKQEASSSASNPVSTQDETIETEERTESQTLSDGHKNKS